MKLNLGCFDKKLPGFINVDIRADINPDVVDDIFKLEKFLDDSANLIYCCHCLEHLTREDALLALARWYEVLKSGGIVRIAVPNMEAVFAHYFYWRDLSLLRSALWGSQRHEYDFHYTGWDEYTLTQDLENVGFINVHKWDHATTEPHNYIDDYSAAYYPDFMGRKKLGNGFTINLGGKLMSLNLEAVKP